ncbi:hypothetical protein GCM10010844_38080 [Deinococcus radiotolerans]|uniref:Uncharacterized protein n=1 Tax=Deinococcus radiotolerans TaxID=1309407 RepID=A0ABQ2FQ07_9DEIO|nr:hypothetical protein GCM10010844_38080 [Deinococcus radiotolerans]
MDVPPLDVETLMDRLGRTVLAAADATGRLDTETDAYDAVSCLLMGTHTAEQLLAQRPGLAPIRQELLQFAQRLEALLDQPAGQPAS